MTDNYSWLDDSIKKQKKNRDVFKGVLDAQERAERENWDTPKRKKR